MESMVYLLQTNYEHILDDGRSKTHNDQEAWLDKKQAENQLIHLVKTTLENKAILSFDQSEVSRLTIDLSVTDGIPTAKIENQKEFETERITYLIKSLILKDDVEI